MRRGVGRDRAATRGGTARSPRRTGARTPSALARLRCDCAESGRHLPARREIRRSPRRACPDPSSAIPRLLWTSTDAGIVFSAMLKMLDGFGRLAGVEQRVREVVFRLGILGTQAKRLMVSRDAHRRPVPSRAAPSRGCCRREGNQARTRSHGDSDRSPRPAARRPASALPRFVSVTARISAVDSIGQLQETAAAVDRCDGPNAAGQAPRLDQRGDRRPMPPAANSINRGTSGYRYRANT